MRPSSILPCSLFFREMEEIRKGLKVYFTTQYGFRHRAAARSRISIPTCFDREKLYTFLNGCFFPFFSPRVCCIELIIKSTVQFEIFSSYEVTKAHWHTCPTIIQLEIKNYEDIRYLRGRFRHCVMLVAMIDENPQ